MSLINDALKKAQKQRTGDSPPLSTLPGVGGETAAKIAKRTKPVGFNSQLMRLALGAGGVLLVIVVGGYFIVRAFHRPSGASPALPAEAKQSAGQTPGGPLRQATAGTNPVLPAGSNGAPTTAPAAITFSLPIAAPATPEPASAPVASAPAVNPPAPAPPATQSPAPRSPLPAPSSPPVKLDAKAISYIENLRIAGIRASATDSKVLMNDRVYRVGDTVEHTLGLKLTGITSSSLTFEDEHGGRYTRNF